MKKKIWHMTTIATESKNIQIYPEEIYEGIVVEIEEFDKAKPNSKFYLDKDEMELFIVKMQEMMNYVNENN